MTAECLEPQSDSACLILASMELEIELEKIELEKIHKKAQGTLFSVNIKIF